MGSALNDLIPEYCGNYQQEEETCAFLPDIVSACSALGVVIAGQRVKAKLLGQVIELNQKVAEHITFSPASRSRRLMTPHLWNHCLTCNDVQLERDTFEPLRKFKCARWSAP